MVAPAPAVRPAAAVRIEEGPGGPRLLARQFVPLPRAAVFAFFEDPRNLARITPPWLSFRLRRPAEPRMAVGARFDYTICWLGLPLRWRTLITEYEPPQAFADSQECGPYALWVHTHRFREAGGGTWVEDEVRFRVPFGPLGRLARMLLVDRQLRGIFEFRARSIESLVLAPPSGLLKAQEHSGQWSGQSP